MRIMGFLLAGLWVGILAGCGASAPTKTDAASGGSSSAPAASKASVPAGLVLTAAPAGAKDVADVKKEAKNGDEVVLRGRVGGREKDVFTTGYASFYLADMKLTPCNERPGDTCKTPWDFCCDDSDVINAGLVNVEVRGGDGKPLKVDLKGVEKIDLLSILVVKGKAVKKENDPNVTIVADGIFVEKGPPKL